jgi:hypothetical protein
MEISKTIDITLPNGTVATIDMSRQMIEKIMSTFTLEDSSMITEMHVKYFLASAMQNALGVTHV